MIRKKNSRLTHKERIQIETLLNENKSKAYISKARSRSTIIREVNKWVQSERDKYSTDLAHWYAKEDYLSKRNFDKKTLRIIQDKLNNRPRKITGYKTPKLKISKT